MELGAFIVLRAASAAFVSLSISDDFALMLGYIAYFVGDGFPIPL